MKAKQFYMFACVLTVSSGVGLQSATAQYGQTNLVSDIPFIAKNLDPRLTNPIGMAFSTPSPFWVANQGFDAATLYNGQGVAQPSPFNPLVVSVPTPTGAVFNGSGNNTDFRINDGTNSAAAVFLFA